MSFLSANRRSEYTGIYDHETFKGMALENWHRDVPEVFWSRLIRDELNTWDNENNYWDNPAIVWDAFSTVDELYNEQVNRVYQAPIKLRIFVQKQSQEQNLKKLGIIEERKNIAKFCVSYMEEKLIPIRFVGIGDLLEYQGHVFSIDTITTEFASEWISSGVPEYIVCKLNTVDRTKI